MEEGKDREVFSLLKLKPVQQVWDVQLQAHNFAAPPQLSDLPQRPFPRQSRFQLSTCCNNLSPHHQFRLPKAWPPARRLRPDPSLMLEADPFNCIISFTPSTIPTATNKRVQ
ncbi:hypothetical protein PtB15_8B528 [Puccinia triticina]|nr:hypothetical protein PtB15_8B528 [Puccinia triticina]